MGSSTDQRLQFDLRAQVINRSFADPLVYWEGATSRGHARWKAIKGRLSGVTGLPTLRGLTDEIERRALLSFALVRSRRDCLSKCALSILSAGAILSLPAYAMRR